MAVAAVALLLCLVAAVDSEPVAKPFFNDIFQKHIQVGDNVTLICTVEVDHDVQFSLTMDYPSERANKSDHIRCENRTEVTENQKKVGENKCVITNVTHADEGYYTCHVTLGTGGKNNDSQYMKVYDNDASYLTLFLGDQPNVLVNLSDGNNTNAFVRVNIKSYPEVDVRSIQWYRDNEIIDSKPQTHIEIKNNETTLEIFNVSLNDNGKYTVKARNKHCANETTFRLYVIDAPRVTVHARESYMYNQTHEINCTVVGFPEVNEIKWFGHFCGLQLECGDVEPTEYNQSSYTTARSTGNRFEKVSTLEITTLESGQVTCSASNRFKQQRNGTANIIVTDMPFSDNIWISFDGKNYSVKSSVPTVEKDNVTLTCGVPVATHRSDVMWYKGDDILRNTSEYQVLNASSTLMHRRSIVFPNISQKHGGIYRCKWTTLDGIGNYTSVRLVVKASRTPFFTGKNNKKTEWEVEEGKSRVTMTCYIDGTPKPTITWYKDNDFLQKDANDTNHIILDKDNYTLTINPVMGSDQGKYRCVGRSRNDVTNKEFTLKVTGTGEKNSTGLIIGIIILAIILIVFLVVLVYKIREAQRIKRDLVASGLNNFKEGAMENFNPDLPIDEQAELLPYDKKWEFPRDRLKMGRQLGAGAFGVVRKAEAWGIVEGESVTTVAVKMVKSSDYAYVRALASELKIMLHLGKHLNVVNLLGACTEELNKKEFLVIVEFCRYGNLQNFVMRHRELFIDQLDPQTGKIDFSKGQELMRKISINSTRSRFGIPGRKLSRGDSSQSVGLARCGTDSSSSALNSDMSVCMSPEGNEEYPILSDASVQPGWRSNFHGDYNKNAHVEPIFTRDLICWAFQVARGMEYLSGRKIMHGDLAARNILLADSNVVKICDFGLAKSMYKNDNYKKKGEGPLPVKWMAIEAIRDRVFSTQSDVWSYGVVLWEIFSLSRTPYPGMEADEKFFNILTSGYRMERPQYATQEIYQLMLDCWEAKPTQRPSFTKLGEQLGAMLEDSVREHYVVLNDPYVAMNKLHSQDHSDYLNMMVAPTYENIMSPSYDDPEHHYVNNPEAAKQFCLDAAANSGYIKMNGSRPDNMIIFSPHGDGAVKGDIFTYPTPPAQRKQGRANESGPAQSGNDLGAEKSPPGKTTSNGPARNIEPVKEMKIANNLNLPGAKGEEALSFSNPNYVGATEPRGSSQQEDTSRAPPVQQQNPSGNYLFMGKQQ